MHGHTHVAHPGTLATTYRRARRGSHSIRAQRSRVFAEHVTAGSVCLLLHARGEKKNALVAPSRNLSPVFPVAVLLCMRHVCV